MEKIGEISDGVSSAQEEISKLDAELDTLQRRRDEVNITISLHFLTKMEEFTN